MQDTRLQDFELSPHSLVALKGPADMLKIDGHEHTYEIDMTTTMTCICVSELHTCSTSVSYTHLTLPTILRV